MQKVKRTKLYSTNELKLEKIQKSLDSELKEGISFVNKIYSDEKKWITANKNPEIEFNNKYYSNENDSGVIPVNSKELTWD